MAGEIVLIILAAIIIPSVTIGYLEYLHTKQVKDLTDKILAKDVGNYTYLKNEEEIRKNIAEVVKEDNVVEENQLDDNEFSEALGLRK
jgi:hypothetical protein